MTGRNRHEACKRAGMLSKIETILLILAAAMLAFPVGDASSAAEPTKEEPPGPHWCETCHASITGLYYKLPGLGEYYCEKCHKTLPHCRFCNRPYSPSRTHFHKTPAVCPKCAATRVENATAALRWTEKIKAIIQSELRLEVPPFKLHLVEKMPREASHPAFRNRDLGMFLRKGEEVEIYLLKGMPAGLFVETLAHEMAHVWQSTESPKLKRIEIKEGFAQWVAGKVLAHLEMEETLHVLKNREDTYGRGYRSIQSIEDAEGIDGVIKYVRVIH